MFKKDRRITDAHCHMQFFIYDNDRDGVIKRAREASVKMIVAGTQISTSRAAIELAHEYPDDIWATVGFHPNHAVIRSEQDTGGTSDRMTRSEQDAGGAIIWHHDKNEQNEETAEKFDIKQLKELAADPKVVGIGECGLDYFRIMNNESGIKNAQKEVFMEMAGLAAELKKPLVIHCRPSLNSNDAYLDLLEMLKNSDDIEFKILHCFSGDLEITKKMVDAGFYFTLGGIVTFPDKKNKNNGAYDEIVRYIPIERIMAETDSPYIAPVPHRGKRNEPSFVVEVVKRMAEIKNVPLGDLAEKLSGTVNKIFKF